MTTQAHKKPRKQKPPRALREFVGKVMQPVLSKRHGMNIELLAAWPELAGDDYRDYTSPQKINWPKRAHHDDPFKPGVLVVACDSERALYFQHDLTRICQRVNEFFGFAAIEKIKIVQKPVMALRKSRTANPERKNPKLDREKQMRLSAILDHIDEPELKARLEALGRGVMATKPEK